MKMILPVLLFLFHAQLAAAVQPGVVETWSDGSLRGWTAFDAISAEPKALENVNETLQVVFRAQSSTPFPEMTMVRADTMASGGAFAGNYLYAGVTGISFRVICDSYVPSDARLFFANPVSGHWWNYPIHGLVGKTVNDVYVPLEQAAGWHCAASKNNFDFRLDLRNVAWIGVRLTRNAATESQTYALDDFRLNGVDLTLDSDGDGMPDWWELAYGFDPHDPSDAHADADGNGMTNLQEYLAGTDPRNPKSVFEAGINAASGMAENGIRLFWNSVSNRTYRIYRTTSLAGVFDPVAIGLEATPPRNTWLDEDATNAASFFYRIGIE